MKSTPEDLASQPLSLEELLAHALAIESEAVQSYEDLAAQMRQCDNTEVADLFDRMAKLEAEHAAKLKEEAKDVEVPELAPWEFRWLGLEAPENIDLAGVHYLMTPYHALKLALTNETAAMAFFEAAAAGCVDERARALAIEFADDERQHVKWMQDWLAKYPPPDEDWDYDPDPPAALG
ncbi:MAG: ferritin family protein [Gammaproteobacteria bacterium]|nr:ferritin family protein [Gammaproteobacteria bacterium]